MAGETRRGLLVDDDAGLAQGIAEEGDQHLAARIQGFEREVRADGFQPQRRIGKAEVKTVIAARHRGARRQHHAAAAVEQVDQVVEPVGVTGELLHRARHREPAIGAVFAVLRERENGPVHDILLRNLSRERHTGQTKRPSHCDDGLRRFGEMKSHRPAFTSCATRDGIGRTTVLMAGNIMAGRAVKAVSILTACRRGPESKRRRASGSHRSPGRLTCSHLTMRPPCSHKG